MSTPLIEAVKELNLQPGQSTQTSVNGYDVEIRRLEEEEESDYAHMVIMKMGEQILPPPQNFDESDLAPE
jgi:hypothetical protein